MGTATVVCLTREETRRMRDELLQELGFSLEEGRELAEDYLLKSSQVARWRRVEELTWLLGE